MKTAIFILSFLFCTFSLSAQYKNSASMIYQPTDNGMGLRFESHNIYASFTKGNYSTSFVTIKNHEKYSLGYLFPFEFSNLSIGLCYHNYSKPIILLDKFNSKVLKPISFEAGFVYKFKRFNIGCSTDILKWECSILLGLNF